MNITDNFPKNGMASMIGLASEVIDFEVRGKSGILGILQSWLVMWFFKQINGKVLITMYAEKVSSDKSRDWRIGEWTVWARGQKSRCHITEGWEQQRRLVEGISPTNFLSLFCKCRPNANLTVL